MEFKHLILLNKHDPDLVLLDMKIPGMDGIEILKRMKAIEPDIRVIIMTAYGELDMIQEAKNLEQLLILRNRLILMIFGQPLKNIFLKKRTNR